MKTRNTKHTERRKNRKIAAVVAALLVVVMSVTSVAYAANGGSLIDAVASLFGIETQAADAGQWTSDPDTHDSWFSGEDGVSTGDNANDSTRNTGRIWTDKSVYTENVTLSSQSGEETFTIENDEGTALVGLSALSSAANISGQTTINRPLDIVLVLDVSGSMDDQLVSYSYNPTYSVNERGTYFVQNEDGSYTQVDAVYDWGWGGREFDHWEVNGQTVEPMRGSGDTGSGRIQFYTRQQASSVSKMDALKSAVNSFIAETGTENAGISNPANQHRISLVKFAGDNMRYAIGDNTYQDGWNNYNYTQVVSDFSTDTTALTNAVNGLDAAGATAADYGFELANDVMEGGYHSGNAWGNYATYTGSRDNAQKVVIFFTDGDPNHGNGFDGSVAASSIDTAYDLKQDGVTVYSIGVMSGADPSDATTDFNRYMNAVSSNYPNAQANGSWDWLQLGDRVSENDQYYYAADSSESLNSIFEAIRDSFGSGATSPIESNDNIGGEPVGYLTFTDTLGDYTEVKNFKSIVFAGQKFTQVSSTTSGDGATTTYTFAGSVNNGTDEGIVYPGEHNLSDIEITVTHGATTQQGDTVTVRIPSTMIPMRLYTAESNTVDGETTTETSVLPAYPIRVYYTVGMKANLVDASGNLDASQIDSNYIASHTDADGNVYFYSNDYDGNGVGTMGVGTTMASFTPATTNSFYYFTQDTLLYTSESTDNPARDYTPGSTYYYQRTYYANDAMHTEWVSFVAAEGQEGNYVQFNQDTSSYYIEQGSPRWTRATEFEAVKDQNTTETATNSIKPAWNGEQVIVTLGNNGKIAYPISGDLQIAKTVNWGTTGVEHNDKDFTYTVDLGGTDTAIEGSFDYIKYNAQGQPVDANGDSQQVAEGAEPVATGQITDGGTLTLKNGERVVISGLPANTAFTVTETAEAGYTASNTVDGTASDNGAVATGTIASNNTIEVAYTNTYAVTPVDLADGSIHGTKILTGRDWKGGESFTFTLSAVTPNAPLPENTSVTLTNTDQTNYAENQQVAFDFDAIQYTAAGRYIYTVQETEGTEYGLTYSNAVYRITVNVVDDGEGDLTAAIESMYRTFNDDGTSTGQDESQWTSIDDRNAVFTNNFLGSDVGIANITGTKSFTDYTSGTTLDINDFRFTITAVTQDAPMPDETEVGNRANGSVIFGDIEFGIDDIGNTYEYDIREVIPAGATDNDNGTSTLNGMTYDNTVKRVSIAITQDQSTGNVVATVTGNGFQFTNSYRASSATTEGAADGLQITKQLDGAAGAEGQFEFTMVAANDATRNAIANGWITGIDVDGNAKTSPAIVKDGSADILFDNLTFTHPGTYTFNVTETKNAPNTAWTYDDHTYQVTFAVTDENGQLVIADPVATSGSAIFTNRYEASMNYDDDAGGIIFGKTLNGRALTANQFNFTVTTPEGDTASDDKLAEATMTLSNRYGAADGAAALWRGIAGLTFDQDDADQTYTFIVSETNGGAAGYTYDDKPVTIQIAVNDDGDGSMSTVTTVTKQDGQTVVYNSEDFVRGDASTYPTAAFVNSYDALDADPVSVNFEKQLTGRDWKDTDNFEFTLTPNADSSLGVTSEELAAAMPGATTAAVSGADEDKTFSFGDFTFTKVGTYAYNVVETQPAAGTDTAGVTYDTRTAVVIFTVTDPGTGKLQVSTRITGVPLNNDTGAGVFVNTYEYTPATLEQNTDTGIGVQKTVTGAPNAEDFTFTATFNADDPQNTGSIDNIEGLADGKLTAAISDDFAAGDTKITDFDTVTFNAPGVYVFDVTEDNTTTAAGWTYDGSTKQIVVTVTDNTEGELVASVEGNDPLFTNNYVPSSVIVGDDETGLQATKSVTGAPALSEFEFTLALTSDNAANVQLGTGETATAFPTDGITMFTTGLTGQEDASEVVDFGDITFTAEDIYTFTVTETTTTDAEGWTYGSGSGAVITVTVTDPNYDGQLDATTVVERDGEQVDTNNPTITNSYDPGSVTVDEGEASGPIQVTKNISGAPAPSDFSFTLTFDGNAEGNTGLLENIQGLTDGSITTSVSQAALDDNTETANFGALTFTEEGDYYFTVTETTQAPNSGWTFDNSPKTVIVHVTDTDHNGFLEASVDDDAAVVNNSYVPSGVVVGDNEADLQVTKQVTGAAALSEFEFTLQLTSDNAGNVQGLGEGNAITMPTDELFDEDADTGVAGSDTVDFGDLTFTAVGDYIFTVTEMTAQPYPANGWNYDNTPRTITVHVTDVNYDGQLDATVDGNNPTVTNSYDHGTLTLTGDSALKVQKTVTGAPNTEDFSFTAAFDADASAAAEPAGDISGIQGAAAGQTFTLNATVSEDFAEGDAAKTASFGDVTFTEPGTYIFNVTENNNTTADGWTYDATTKTVTVKVTDDGEGALEADVIYDNNVEGAADGDKNVTDAAAFTNSYKASSVIIGEGDVAGINVQKTLTGRDWLEGDSFTFTLTAQDGAPMPAEGGDTISITNGDNPKTAVFGSIEFDAEGEYKYTVKEIKPEEGALGGVTYDTHETTVTVSVTDTDYDGKLEARVSYDNGSATTDEDQAVTNAAAFTNTYAASSTTLSGAENLKVEKELTGRDWIASDSFTFTLAGAGDITNNAIDDGIVVLPDPAEITISGNTGDHAATFEDITFTKAGTYTFTVTESGDVPGVINDPKAVRTITVKVTDNNDGTLTAEVVGGESEDLKFTNTYDPGTITLTGDSALKVQKTLRGREWADGEAYSFTIKSTSAPEGVAAEDIPMPGETEINIGKPADGNVNTATFGDMTFSQAGEYVYEITEVIPEAAEENMTYDGYHVTVTIIVAEDQAAGELTAHVTYNNGDQKVDDDNNNNERNNNDDEFVTDAAAFTNVKSVETTYNLEGTKVIEGRDFQEGDAFTFELRAVDKAPLPKDGENIITSVTIDQDDVREDEVNTADISFGKITFTEPGQYVYKISEIEPEEADRIEGMTYDTAERSVIIEVTADEQGNMTAEMIEPADGLVWTNTWADDTEPVLSGLTGTKNLTGTAMAEGQFTFLIQPQGNAPMGDSMMAAFNGEVTQNEDGSYTAPISLLNNVTYTENGDYVYIISEVNDGQRGITYDTTKYRVTVHVDGGNVTTGIESTTDEAITGDTEWTEAEAIVFNNSYTTSLNYNTAGGLSIIKNLKGHDIAADQFGFTVKAADDASREKAGFKEMSQNYATSASRMNGNGVSTDSMSVFGDIAFTQADAGKTYTYTISETTGGNTDAGYTNDTRTYTVEITTADDGKGSLTVTTQVTSDQGDEATYTYSNKAGTDQPAVVTFDNTYEASGGIGGEGQVSIIAKKELANSTLNGDDFTFTITDEAGKEVASGTNDASGTITFSEIDYTKDSLIADVASGAAVYSQVDGKDTYTYQYTVAETGDMPDGVSQVAASFQIQVTVTDNNDGTLSAAVTYPEGSEDGLVFRNTYGSEAEAQINVAGKKILNVESGDNVPDITHKYRFTITGADEDGNQAPLPGNTTVANDATGSVTFGDIVYTMENVFGNDPVTESVDEVSGETTEATADVHTDEAQTDDVQTDEAQTDEASGAVSEEADNTADNVRGAERTKTFYYTVTEAGSVAGVTNDPDDKTFTVTVKDNGDGTLSVESSATAGAQFEFVNTYSVDPTDPESPTDPDAEGGVTITKVLEGRDLKEGEFQFTMTGIAGTISEGMSVSGQNDAEGNVVLGGLVFEAPGTYEFNISEVIPDTLLGGVTYDGHIYTALANVKDNGDGTLSVAWTVSNGTETVDQITFTNTYKADAVGNVIFQATKKLEGRDLKDGEFTFQLKDENGEVISEAANTVNGSVRFDALSFDKAGTYNYTVSEVKGNDDTITYDDTVYNVTVTVTDDLQGHLVATVTGEGGNELNMTFNNKYTKPAEPQNPDDDGTPKAVQTGDTTPIIPAVIAVLVSLAAIAAVVVIIMRRRRR